MGLKFQNLRFNTMQNSILEQAKVDHEIRQIWLSTLKKKQNLVFYFPLSVSKETKFRSHSLYFPNSGILKTRMDRRRTLWKIILAIFKYKNEYHRQLDIKN